MQTYKELKTNFDIYADTLDNHVSLQHITYYVLLFIALNTVRTRKGQIFKQHF